METRTNAWGELVEEHKEKDEWHVPESERNSEDFPEEPNSNALSVETGNDLDGWEPGDPV